MKFRDRIITGLVLAAALATGAFAQNFQLQIPSLSPGSSNTFTGILQQFGSTTSAPVHLSTAQTTAPAADLMRHHAVDYWHRYRPASSRWAPRRRAA